MIIFSDPRPKRSIDATGRPFAYERNNNCDNAQTMHGAATSEPGIESVPTTHDPQPSEYTLSESVAHGK